MMIARTSSSLGESAAIATAMKVARTRTTDARAMPLMLGGTASRARAEFAKP